MPRLLFIGQVWPEPACSAAGGRTMSLVHLFLQHSLQVVFASAATRGEFTASLELDGLQTADIALNDERFDRFVADLAPDIVVFDRFMTEEQFGWRVEKVCPDALRVLDTIDLHFLREARRKAVIAERDATDTINLDFTTDLALREIASILRSDLSLIMSGDELELLRDRFNIDSGLLHRVPFLLEAEGFSTASPGYSRRMGFATIGNFRHAPNWDAVLWLREQIWPRIRTLRPDAQLNVYGAYAPKKATAIDDVEGGFRVRGWVPNERQVLENARVCLAPLRFGAGLKGKLAQAMLAGTPSVTTKIGAESMNRDGASWCGIIAESPAEIAKAAVELHDDETSWTKTHQRGFEIAHREFDAKREGTSLINRLDSCRSRLQERRRSNFIGTMLRHHQHRSTEYMSRWIETKTKLEEIQDELRSRTR